jgi:hypothetical protein
MTQSSPGSTLLQIAEKSIRCENHMLKKIFTYPEYALNSLVYTLAGTDFSVGTVQENHRLLET